MLQCRGIDIDVRGTSSCRARESSLPSTSSIQVGTRGSLASIKSWAIASVISLGFKKLDPVESVVVVNGRKRPWDMLPPI
jgi:hypothetical protein